MRSPQLHFFVASIFVVNLAHAASFDARVEALFRPPHGEMMALSPDGQRVAYTTQARTGLAIVLANVEHPGPHRTVPLETGRDTANTDDAPPTQLRFLRWATNSRLVYAPTVRVVPLPPLSDKHGRLQPNPDGPAILSPVMAVDADGKQRGTLVDARDFQEIPTEARRSLADLLRTPQEIAASRHEPIRWRMPRVDILGFHPRDREQLIIGTSGAYSMPMQHLVDLRAGHVREFGGDWPVPPSAPQVYDWFRLKVVGERRHAAQPATTWSDDDLARAQRELAEKFPRRTVELLDWSDTRARVLFRVTGGSDPGRIFVYQRPEDLVQEILKRTPWLNSANLHDTRFLDFTAPDGARLTGYLTWPRKPTLHPPPLLVVLPAGFPGGAQPAFDPEAQVFADLGFAVARLNHRGVAGVRPEDISILRSAIDRVSVNDAAAAIDEIAARHPDRTFDRRRVAALGRGFGGYLALRALQLRPTLFRCGIVIDAPAELRPWLKNPAAAGPSKHTAAESPGLAATMDHAATEWEKLSVLSQTEALTQPVFILVEPQRNPAVDASAAELRAKLTQLGRAPDHHELDPGFSLARPIPRAAVYRKIEEFLQRSLAEFSVKIGPTTEVK